MTDPNESWLPVAHIYYTAGDWYTRCHEVTHAVCGAFHSNSGRIDKQALERCAEESAHAQ